MYRLLCKFFGLPDYEWKYHRLMGYLEARAAESGTDRENDWATDIAVHNAIQAIADYAKAMDMDDRL